MLSGAVMLNTNRLGTDVREKHRDTRCVTTSLFSFFFLGGRVCAAVFESECERLSGRLMAVRGGEGVCRSFRESAAETTFSRVAFTGRAPCQRPGLADSMARATQL